MSPLVSRRFLALTFLAISSVSVAIAQGIVLVLFIVLGIVAVRSFHPEAKAGALSMA